MQPAPAEFMEQMKSLQVLMLLKEPLGTALSTGFLFFADLPHRYILPSGTFSDIPHHADL